MHVYFDVVMGIGVGNSDEQLTTAIASVDNSRYT